MATPIKASCGFTLAHCGLSIWLHRASAYSSQSLLSVNLQGEQSNCPARILNYWINASLWHTNNYITTTRCRYTPKSAYKEQLLVAFSALCTALNRQRCASNVKHNPICKKRSQKNNLRSYTCPTPCLFNLNSLWQWGQCDLWFSLLTFLCNSYSHSKIRYSYI